MLQFWNDVMAGLRNQLQVNGGIYLQFGTNMYALTAVSVFALLGANLAWKHSRGGDISMVLHESGRLLIRIGFYWMILIYWLQPLPGVGLSFPQVITRTTEDLAHQTTQQGAQDFEQALSNINLNSPSTVELVTSEAEAIFDYWVWRILIFVSGWVTFLVGSFGIFVETFAIMVGPLFIWTVMIPRLESFFWSWLRFFIQYSFFQVAASLVGYILWPLLTNRINAASSTGVWSIAVQYVQFQSIGIFLCVYVVLLLSLPIVIAHLFSGSSGSGWSPAAIVTTLLK